jgi:hypothetical protein
LLEIQSHEVIRAGSNRGFGLLFAVVFLLAGYYFLLKGSILGYALFAASLAFLLLAIFSPDTLSSLNKAWLKLGLLLGSVVAPLVMVLIYFLAIAPTAVILRILQKDLLNLKMDKTATTYWIPVKESSSSMKDQF